MASRLVVSQSAGRRRGQVTEGGFSLTELLIVLALISLAVLIAVPSLQRARVKARTNQGVSDVQAVVDLARTEALKRHSPVAADVSLGHTSFVVFEDWNPPDGAVSPGEEVIQRRRLDAHVSLTNAPAGDPDGFAALGVLAYESDGTVRTGTAGAAYIRDRVGNVFRVNVNPFTGSVRTEMWIAGQSRWTARREDWEWKY